MSPKLWISSLRGAYLVKGVFMLKFLSNRKEKDQKGFSLVELLVVLLIMSIMAGVAVPLYLNQRNRAYLQTAVSDATSIGQEITAIVSDYTTWGAGCTANLCPITIASNALVFTGPTAATATGLAVVGGPGTTTSIVRVSGTGTLSGNTSATAGTALWCIIVTNNGSYAKYTNAGLVKQQIAGTAPTCVAGA